MTEAKEHRAAVSQAPRPKRFGTRLVLVLGFGGLLALMTTAGADSLRVLHEIQSNNAQIHRDFLSREHLLDQIRDALYLSGTVVRDYILLDPGQSTTETLRAELRSIRQEMDSALRAYGSSLQPNEQAHLRELNTELDAYWTVLNPIFEWDADKKRELGYWFLRQQLFPRRNTVLNIAREISAVNERTLQEGEKRVADLFARFSRHVRIATRITLGLGLLVAVLSILYILRLEKSADQRFYESVRAQGELKDLSARLVSAQEQERHAISRELHDEVGQSLSALLMDLGNLAATVPAADGDFQEHVSKIKTLAENSMNAVRNMSLLLRPSMLDDLGLVPALEWQAREVMKRTAMLVELVEENVSDNLGEAHKTCVYRIVQEALHNCSQHARARSVRMLVRQEPERLLLTIEDDGRGFDARRVRGLGLIGMSERVTHLGGTFEVESTPGHGTRLRIELPLAGSGKDKLVAA